MGNPLRNRDPEIYRLITIRTVRRELWLAPDGRNRRVIGGVIARYQEIFGIEIYAYAVLSNHIHLLVRSPRMNVDEFAENVHREIARRINWRYRREGALWARRYTEQEVVREEDLVDALLYISTNCTRHGLLRDASHWKGLHSYNHLISESDRRFSFTHYSITSSDGVPLKTKHKLRLSILPRFRQLSSAQRKKRMTKLLRTRLEDLWEARGGRPYLGAEELANQMVGSRPEEARGSKRPGCYSKCPRSIKEFLRARRLLRERYAEASFEFRLGDLSVEFPIYTFKPPLHRLPRRRRFEAMSPVTVPTFG